MELPFRAPPRFRTVLAILLLVLCALLPAFGTARTALAAPLGGRTIVVGGDQDYPPYEFLGPDGAPTGYNVDLTRAIAEVMGFPVQIRLGRWSDIRRALEKGEIDAIHGMFRSPEREAVVDFSIPHSVVAHAIIVRKDSPPINSVDDLRGKEIIVMDGDIMHDFVRSQHLTDAIYPVETQADALCLLSSGQHDCVLAARQPSLYWMRKLKLDNLIVTGPPLAPSEYCYAVKKGDTRLLAAINRGLSILQRTGRYQQIEQAWLGVLDDRSQALRRTAKELGMGLGAALAVLLAILAWNRSLRRQVAARMRETEAARAALAEQAALAGALAGLFRELLTVTDMGNAAALILDKARTLTHSPYGCVGRIDPATGRLIASSSARNIPDDQPLQENALSCDSSAGLPGWALTNRRPLLINDPASDPRSAGTSEGRWPIRRFLAAPAMAGGTLLGQVVVANAPRDYTAHDLEVLEQLAGVYALTVQRIAMEADLLTAKENAEAASRSKSEFLANMSHEIRTPLNGVLGMLQILKHSPLSEDQTHLAQTALSCGRGLLRLLEDILDLSMVEAGKLQTRDEAFELAKALDSVIDPLLPEARRKGVDLLAEALPGTPQTLLGDAGRIRQILFNLVGNAVKFTHRGEVRLTAEALPWSDPAHVELQFTVTDTGIGIPRDKLDAVLSPFVQAESGMSRDYGGAGLGLSIASRLVGLLGGTMVLESEEGVGTTVRVRLCFRLPGQTAEASAGEAVLPKPAVPGARVLVVEDDPMNRMVAVRLLKERGLAVSVAVNGREALDRVAQETFDLVVMDVKLPVMDGLEATRRIRSGEALDPGVPILALTAYAMAGDREFFLAAGMDDYVAKPLTAGDLYAALDRLLAASRVKTPTPE